MLPVSNPYARLFDFPGPARGATVPIVVGPSPSPNVSASPIGTTETLAWFDSGTLYVGDSAGNVWSLGANGSEPFIDLGSAPFPAEGLVRCGGVDALLMTAHPVTDDINILEMRGDELFVGGNGAAGTIPPTTLGFYCSTGVFSFYTNGQTTTTDAVPTLDANGLSFGPTFGPSATSLLWQRQNINDDVAAHPFKVAAQSASAVATGAHKDGGIATFASGSRKDATGRNGDARSYLGDPSIGGETLLWQGTQIVADGTRPSTVFSLFGLLDTGNMPAGSGSKVFALGPAETVPTVPSSNSTVLIFNDAGTLGHMNGDGSKIEWTLGAYLGAAVLGAVAVPAACNRFITVVHNGTILGIPAFALP